jgi:hypothetical protein
MVAVLSHKKWLALNAVRNNQRRVARAAQSPVLGAEENMKRIAYYTELSHEGG